MSNDKTREAFLAALNKVSDGAYLIPGWDVHSIKAALSASEGAAPVAAEGLRMKPLEPEFSEFIGKNMFDLIGDNAAPQPAVNGAGLSEPIKGKRYEAGDWSMRNWEAMREDGNLAPDAQARPVAKDWPEAWQRSGFNRCVETAVQALHFLAHNERPRGGGERYNAEHLLQTADELRATLERISAPTAPPAEAQPAPAADVDEPYGWVYQDETGRRVFVPGKTAPSWPWKKPAMTAVFTRPAAPLSEVTDAQILDWLETKCVEVREPLVYGSRAMFFATPEQDDPAFPAGPSDIRSKVRAAIAATSVGEGKA